MQGPTLASPRKTALPGDAANGITFGAPWGEKSQNRGAGELIAPYQLLASPGECLRRPTGMRPSASARR
jgi:hypothetical protein